MRLAIRTWGQPAAERQALLLHGITSNAGSWVRTGPALARRGFYVLAPDLRGHGKSRKADGHYLLDDFVGDLSASLPRHATLLVGHSFGGVLATLAVRGNVLVPDVLVLEDPVLHFADRELPARLLADDEANLPRTVEGTLRANPRWLPVDAEEKVASLAAIDWNHMSQAFSGNAPWDLRSAVVEIGRRLPVLIILPERSFYVPSDDAAQLAAELGDGSVVKVPGTGHSIHRDDLAAYLGIVERFLGSKLTPHRS